MCGILLKILNRKIKVVYHVRLLRNSYIGPLYSSFIRVIKRYADAVVCCSNAVSNDVGNLPNKIVIYDSEFFDEAADDALHVHLQPKRIVYVGNILPGKGQDWAIKAFALVQEDFPETKLYFIGKYDHNGVSTNFKKTVDSLIDELGLEGKVIFEGFKANVDDELRRADIVLNLSESESFSMVCLEALKAGVPLIASDCGGPAELFKHMESGWLVPNKDFVAAAVAIRTLANSNEIRLRFSKRGQESARATFDVANNCVQLDALYQKVLNG